MKVCLVQDWLRNGGTERQTLFLARAFMEAGHEVTMIVFRPGGRLINEARELPSKLRILQRFDSGLPLFAPGLLAAVRDEAPDAVLCMGRTANCYAGAIQRKLPQTAVISTLRTGKALFPLHSRSLNQVRAVLVNSNWWKRRMLERGFPPERICVVHNAVVLHADPRAQYQERRRLRKQEKVPPNVPVFLNVATFRRGKRHIDLLRLFARLRTEAPELDWRLWLVGEGKEFRRCRNFAHESGLDDYVRFFGYQAKPFPYYCAGDVAVSTSQEDSLPNFLIEAQAMGLPLVAYDCRGVVECCRPGETGIVPAAGDAEAFFEALCRIASSSGELRRLAEGAPAFARETFSPTRQARWVLDFVEKLVVSP